jgi:hypothetical protein
MKLFTFDFDSTLCLASPLQMSDWTEEERKGREFGIPFEPMLDRARWLNEQGHMVALLTTRKDEHMSEVHEFVEHFELPFNFVWNTNFRWKAEFMLEILDEGLSIHHHFDDNIEEFGFIQKQKRLNHVGFSLIKAYDHPEHNELDCRAEENQEEVQRLLRSVCRPSLGGWGL